MDPRIVEQVENLEAVLAQIPPEHRGVGFERVLESFHPQENTRRLELAFALSWASRNSEGSDNLLVHLLHAATIAGKEPDPRAAYLPQNEREWKVACLVAATLIQWLPTSVGCGFLCQAFEKAGGKFSYELPDTTGYEAPRR